MNNNRVAFTVVGTVNPLPGRARSSAAVIAAKQRKNETSWLQSLFLNSKLHHFPVPSVRLSHVRETVMSTEQDKDSFSLKRNRGNVDFLRVFRDLFRCRSWLPERQQQSGGLQAFGEEQKSRQRYIQKRIWYEKRVRPQSERFQMNPTLCRVLVKFGLY